MTWSRAFGATPVSRSTPTTRSTTSCASTAPTGDRGPATHPAEAVRGRARLVLGADALVLAAEAGQAVEPCVLAPGRDPGAPLPRARPGRPLRLRAGNGASRRS